MSGYDSNFLFEIEKRTFPLLMETFLFALYVVLVVYLVHRRRSDRVSTPLSAFMLSVALAMFLLFCISWSIGVYSLWVWIAQGIPARDPGRPSAEEVLVTKPLFYAQNIAFYITIVLGDIISLWRAYVIFGRPRWLLILFIGIVSIESMLYIASMILTSPRFSDPTVESKESFNLFLLLTTLTQAIGYTAFSSTAFAQSFSTLLIAYKAWSHWKDVREFTRITNTRVSLALLAIIVESGVVYLALIVSYILLSYYDNILYLGNYISIYYTTPLIAMYPILVVFLVATRRSVLERTIHMASSRSLPWDVASGAHDEGDESRLRCPRCQHVYVQEIAPRLEVSFGPSIGLRSVVVGERDHHSGGEAESPQILERQSTSSRSHLSSANASTMNVYKAEGF